MKVRGLKRRGRGEKEERKRRGREKEKKRRKEREREEEKKEKRKREREEKEKRKREEKEKEKRRREREKRKRRGASGCMSQRARSRVAAGEEFRRGRSAVRCRRRCIKGGGGRYGDAYPRRRGCRVTSGWMFDGSAQMPEKAAGGARWRGKAEEDGQAGWKAHDLGTESSLDRLAGWITGNGVQAACLWFSHSRGWRGWGSVRC